MLKIGLCFRPKALKSPPPVCVHVCACVHMCMCVYVCVHVSMHVHLHIWHFKLRHIRESHMYNEKKTSEFMAQRQLCDNSTNLGFIVRRCGFYYFFFNLGQMKLC